MGTLFLPLLSIYSCLLSVTKLGFKIISLYRSFNMKIVIHTGKLNWWIVWYWSLGPSDSCLVFGSAIGRHKQLSQPTTLSCATYVHLPNVNAGLYALMVDLHTCKMRMIWRWCLQLWSAPLFVENRVENDSLKIFKSQNFEIEKKVTRNILQYWYYFFWN